MPKSNVERKRLLLLAAAAILIRRCRRRRNAKRRPHGPATARQRLEFSQRYELSDRQFHRTYRMPKTGARSFPALVEKLRPDLDSEDYALWADNGAGGPISAELKLSMALRFLAGGSYLDIYPMHGVSEPLFYQAVWQTVDAMVEPKKGPGLDTVPDLQDYLNDEEELRRVSDGFAAKGPQVHIPIPQRLMAADLMHAACRS